MHNIHIFLFLPFHVHDKLCWQPHKLMELKQFLAWIQSSQECSTKTAFNRTYTLQTNSQCVRVVFLSNIQPTCTATDIRLDIFRLHRNQDKMSGQNTIKLRLMTKTWCDRIICSRCGCLMISHYQPSADLALFLVFSVLSVFNFEIAFCSLYFGRPNLVDLVKKWFCHNKWFIYVVRRLFEFSLKFLEVQRFFLCICIWMRLRTNEFDFLFFDLQNLLVFFEVSLWLHLFNIS